MKIGIISDVHSNIQALTAVLNEFDKMKIDKIICCGDIIGIGINPEETVQELLKRKDILTSVRGNHEQYLLKGLPKRIHNREMTEDEVGNHKWNHNKLSQNSIEFLKEFNSKENIEIEGKKLFVVHYPQNSDGTYKKHIKNPNNAEIKELFEEYDNNDVFLFGHTHTYYFNNINDKLFINVGSLGCPLNSNIAKAGLLEINKNDVVSKYWQR